VLGEALELVLGEALELVLGEASLEVVAPGKKLIGAGTSFAVNRVIPGAVAPASHRERILPAGHVGLQVRLGLGQIGS
jgi:hypothetical protein